MSFIFSTSKFHVEKLKLSIYGMLLIFSGVLGAVKLSLYAAFLSTEDFGLYSLTLSIYIFVIYSGTWGLGEGLMKVGSIAHGKGDNTKIVILRDSAMFVGALGISVVSTLVFVVTLFFDIGQRTSTVLFLACFLGFSTYFFNIANVYFRATQQFILFAFSLFIKSLLVIVSAYFFSNQLGFSGLVLLEAILILFISTTLVFFSKDEFKFREIFKSSILIKTAVLSGAPVMVSNLIKALTMSVDRWAISASLGVIALSKYAFAMILFQIALVVLNLFNTVLGSKWLAEFGRSGDVSALHFKVKRVIYLFLFLSLVLAIPVINFFWYLTERFYPSYSEADVKVIVYFIYVGTSLSVASYILDWFFIGSSNERLLLKISLVTLLFSLVISFFLYIGGSSIVLFSISFALVRFLSFISLALFSFKVLEDEISCGAA